MSDTFFNAPPSNTDEDTVYTMGGLDGLPGATPTTQSDQPEAPSYLSRIMPDINLGDFIGSAAQLSQLFPGTQVKPSYQPGLTDIRFTRGYYGPQEDVMPSGFGTESAGTLFWSPQRYQMPAPTYQTQQPQQDDEERQRRENEAILQTALGMDWSGAYQDYLDRLEAQNQDINISNVFTPTNVNYQTQSQWQKQSMGGDGQYQEQDTDTDTDTSYLDQILERVVGTSISPRVSVRTSTVVGTSITPYTSLISSVTVSSGSRDTDTDVSDLEIFDDTTYGTTTSTVKGGQGNDSVNLDDRTIDFDIGKRDPDIITETEDGGLTQVDTAAEEAERKRKADEAAAREAEARRQAEENAQRERERLAAEEAERERQRKLAEEEAARRKAANEQTVRDAYQQVFGRSDVDQEGLDYWSGQVASGKSSTDLLRDLVSGAQGADVQAAQNTDTVSKLYQDLLDRTPDAEGLSYYRQQLAAGASPEEVAQNIISGARAGSESSKISQAEIDRYFPQPVDTSTSTRDTSTSTDTGTSVVDTVNNISDNEQFVRDAYQSLFGREADAEGLAYFTNELDSGASQVDIVNNMLSGAQGADLARVQDYQQSADDLKEALFYTIQNTAAGDTLDEQKANIVNALAENYPEVFGDLVGNATGLGDYITAANAIFSAETGGEAAKNLVEAFGTSVLSEAAAYALAAQGLPVVGQVVGAAIVLDSLLSEALGYDSPIQDGISWLANSAEDAVNWFSDVAGDLFGGIGDFFGGLFAEGGMVGYQEGGLVGLAEQPSYSYPAFYGAQSQMPALSLDEVQPMEFAGGGLIPLLGGGKVARGPGGGLDDLIPTSIDGKRAAALSDGEFVIPADVVSMMGDGSSNAGAKRLYDLVRQIRQDKTGTSKQAGPLQMGKLYERIMK